MPGLWLGNKTSFLENKKTKKSVQYSQGVFSKKRTKHRAEKEEENIGRLKLYLQSEVNTVHKFFCLRNSIYVHVINDNVTH